ncbi:MAG: patatin-like phospholipase family protein [Proteobacteria bacterium]|nr:patatin-like phospholipase family protein [Pseudomonadota bacterium]
MSVSARHRAVLGVLALLGVLAAPASRAEAAPTRPKVCLVLSGGGARGIAHIGVLRVLEELHVPIDCLVGTSAGAIIGGAYAAGASPDQIETAMRTADWDRLLTDQPERAERSPYAKELDREQLGAAEVGQRGAGLLLPRGVVTGQHLQFYLQALVAPAARGPFDALPIPYRAIATDFESGEMVVLDHGDLAAAIRASMSVPGAFAPVEIDGRLLVDGGLVRNVGIDVARRLGAERVIVVNVGTPLLRRAELGSLLSAAEQTLTILTEQNVANSIATLGPDDVLIRPELGNFSSTDFAHGTSQIPAAEAATRAAAPRLAALAVAPDEYQHWVAAHRRERDEPRYARLELDTTGLTRVAPAAVRRLVGADLDPADPDAVIREILRTDDFESVVGTVVPGSDGATLVLRPVEKPWGPNYVHAAGELATDFAGESDFLLSLDHRATWLNDRGLEWRNRVRLGWTNSLDTELRQPLDAARHSFVAPTLELSQQQRSLYADHDPLGTYRLRRLRGGIDLGVLLGAYGELRVGLESGFDSVALTSGEPVQPDRRERVAAWRASLVLDRLDDLDFPRHGFLLSADAHLARRMLGSETTYDRVAVEAQQAFGSERTSFLFAARYDSALGGTLPLAEAFTLGGFQNLSGLKRDQLLASRVAFVRAVVRERLATFAPFLPALYGGVSLEGADVGGRFDGSGVSRLYGGALFLSADSAIGPLYLGLGVAEHSFVSLYLSVGRP